MATSTKIAPESEAERALVKFNEEIDAYEYPPTTLATAEQFEDAANALREIKGKQRRLEELRRSATRPLDEAKQAIMRLFRGPETRLAQIETSLKKGITDYNRRVEEERRKLEAELRERQAREQAKLEARAEKLREQGHDEKAEAALARIPAVPIVVADKPRVEGVSQRGIWKAEVVDLKALVEHCLASGNIEAYLVANLPALNNAARSFKGTAKIPGVRFYEEASVVVRA